MNNDIRKILSERILVLDGAMGTMIQRHNLSEEDFRGNVFKTHTINLKGINDVLNLTNPDIIYDIHKQYLCSGADIIETNTFNSSSLSLLDYGLEDFAYEINKAGATIARNAIRDFVSLHPDKIAFVAGSIGPTNKTASLPDDINNPSNRSVSFDELYNSYKIQTNGLIDGGVDIILIETIFDTINAKAALAACNDVLIDKGISLPIMLSVTISQKGGRTLSGQTIEAFIASFSQANLLSIGLNCSFGAKDMKPHLYTLAKNTSLFVSAYPNAGLPNHFGDYDQSPEEMANHIRDFVIEGLVNIVGGCCGTTPNHIREIANVVRDFSPRLITEPSKKTIISGLEPLCIDYSSNFINIGERTNVAGSRKFARLIREKKYEEALSIALDQVENGAQVIDVNFDDGLLDSKNEMITFLNYIGADPEIARVPIMIDSSRWEVIDAGLKCIQGKAIVNSISLKDGEKEFLDKATKIIRYGAAIVVMGFDEDGQASDFESKIRICKRAYDLLVGIGFPAQDIIFDCNILTIATGISEHNRYAIDFINAVKWVKDNLPLCKTSGGISNLSFSFKGNDKLRESIHAVFLFHAIKAGLDMGIVNAGKLPSIDDMDVSLRKLIEDLIFNRRKNAIERLVSYSEKSSNNIYETNLESSWHDYSAPERIKYALIKGHQDYIIEDIEEYRRSSVNSLSIIEGPLMEGMNEVGLRFQEGKMFLPQILKSARVMKKAVTYLSPFIKAENISKSSSSAGKILMATVKGDVHDIGKNIAKVVLECNNFEIIDLGVMISKEEIADAAILNRVDIVGLSGLITPSLDEMCNIAKEFEKRKLSIPIMVGGAATSELHTAIKIVPNYSGFVVNAKDASDGVKIASSLMSYEKNKFIDEIDAKYSKIIEKYNITQSKITYIPLNYARKKKYTQNWEDFSITTPNTLGSKTIKNIPIPELIELIDWSLFLKEMDINGKWPEIESDIVIGDKVRNLVTETREIINKVINYDVVNSSAVYGIYKACSIDEKVEVYVDDNTFYKQTLCFLRNQERDKEINYCLSDFIAPKSENKDDYIGLFTIAVNIDERKIKDLNCLDDYELFIVKILANQLAEATTQHIHFKIRSEIWAYANEKYDPKSILKGDYVGIRPAPGYASCPDHSEKLKIVDLLDASNEIGVNLTENFMISPISSICGYFFANPNSVYFNVGKISEDQTSEYSNNKGLDINTIEKYLSENLNYR